MTAATESTLKPRQLQVARLRREEDEESWISGEELYTEGSSDDEITSLARSRSPAHHAHYPRCPTHLPLADQSKKAANTQHSPLESPPLAASEPATQDDPHLTETTRRLSQMGVEEAAAVKDSACATDTQQVEEQEEVMLWRPKRGSIKLPHVELDPPSSLLQQQVTG